jgi:hypothetical protein
VHEPAISLLHLICAFERAVEGEMPCTLVVHQLPGTMRIGTHDVVNVGRRCNGYPLNSESRGAITDAQVAA